ncbi:MAG: M43 family zinc metalloprotease [Bacteroidia bacterium]
MRNYLQIVFAVWAVLSYNSLTSEAQIRCWTHEHHQNRISLGQHAETDAQFESWMNDRLRVGVSWGNLENEYNIPVVFHIIYQNPSDAWNISTAQVQSQVQVLNEDFKRLNADTLNAPAGFRAVAAGSNINFCLAQRDPQGNPSSGIVRWAFSQNSSWSTSAIDATIKPATVWDPTRYLNIWVVNISGGILGYAQFPVSSGLAGLTNSGAANTDGVVLLYSSVGRPPANPFSSVYNRGRTATHEVGHWLGLRHIWGDGSSCTATDYCADTPPSDAANFGCATTHSSCSGPDMVQNYMDYSDDLCMNLFTLNQVQRMWTVLANSPRRASLLTANSCQPVSITPGPLTAAFGVSDSVADFGGSVDTVVLSDQSIGVPSSRLWTLTPSTGWSFAPGSSATDAQPRLTFSVAGLYQVKLRVTNSFGSDSLTRSACIRARAAACLSGATDPVDTRIASWTLAGTTYASPTGTGNCATYTDRTNLAPFQVNLGQTYSATLVKGTCGSNYAAYAKVYLDFNRNFVFEGNEMIMSGSLTNAASASLTSSNITIPSGQASAGLCLLRVVLHEGGSATQTQACGTYQWGETQDYLVQINNPLALPLTGLVTYNNVSSTPLPLVTVRLLSYPAMVQESSVVTNAQGSYSLGGYTNGTKTLTLQTGRTWGGVNATDALLANLHFSNTQPLSGLRLRAADVNASGTVNASDALVISRRYANVISSFPSGDWVFDTAIVNLTGLAQSRNLQGLCYGDVNGSLIPGAARWGSTTMPLEETNESAWNSSINNYGLDNVMEVYSTYSGSVGALSLDINWPEFLGEPRVQFLLGAQEPVVAWRNGRLRLAWNDPLGVHITEGMPIMKILHRCQRLLTSWTWETGPGSEWADPWGQPIPKAGLRLPSPWRFDGNNNARSMKIWPNPARDFFGIELDPELLEAYQTQSQRDEWTWVLRDPTGRVVVRQRWDSGEINGLTYALKPGPLAGGLYTVELHGKGRNLAPQGLRVFLDRNR